MSIKWLLRGVLCFLVWAIMCGYQLQQIIMAKYRFERDYLSKWELADKSSTIEAKAIYIGQFVGAIESNVTDFSEYNVLYLKTANNSFAQNLAALKTLNVRLQEIMKMDIKSFEYQTAIQQITQQEQGEAQGLLDTIYGCWVKEKYPVAWEWYKALYLLITLCLLFLWIASGIWTLVDNDPF